MTLLKLQNNSKISPSFNSIFNDWFNDGYFDKVALGTSMPAVNVQENDRNFLVSFAAPGMNKEDFKISLHQNLLTISAEKSTENEEQEKSKFTKREYSYHSFSRSFTLPDTIDNNSIDANYENGELKISIPKKEKSKTEMKEISVK